MSEQDRRTFLKRAACAVPGAAVAASLGVTACTPEGETPPARPTTGILPTAPLRAVADVVLPSGVLGEDAMAAAVGGFMDWVCGVPRPRGRPAAADVGGGRRVGCGGGAIGASRVDR